MLEYDRNDINKASGQRKCIICHYWYFLEIKFISQPKVCDGFSKNHNHYYLKIFKNVRINNMKLLYYDRVAVFLKS